ncbi:hypothetical protein THAOC_10076 [Thalassiosira oceanica]|uniref:Uncharacterized protein n=1 Tax=Thalassiosira oceanica TaxID=159749 RepID=K0T617_THAOC|nr:hypothetical protein THAOC_10076 [Thalassiosira oceanica]|eukprot:EJK68721.1 hypothetical protein THAOC_10076 [Thalassiosira oceanica]
MSSTWELERVEYDGTTGDAAPAARSDVACILSLRPASLSPTTRASFAGAAQVASGRRELKALTRPALEPDRNVQTAYPSSPRRTSAERQRADNQALHAQAGGAHYKKGRPLGGSGLLTVFGDRARCIYGGSRSPRASSVGPF